MRKAKTQEQETDPREEFAREYAHNIKHCFPAMSASEEEIYEAMLAQMEADDEILRMGGKLEGEL